jgi:alkanesulfonate monooxygenase SsuD/methylene tetrahydromethanopterin reductase-like flavin-dependent oxidoreductase (luciferase family)
MLTAYFTEQALKVFPKEADAGHEDDHPARSPGDRVLLLSNKYFDREVAKRLYEERMAEYRLVEEVGFDGIMINEHHYGAYCQNTRCNITTTAVAAMTERVKLIQAGSPLPIWDNPVQLAEEIAMIDLLSGGRVVAGILRGGGIEQLANNVNPAFNRERFAEAHDLLIKTWTVPGPWRWDGEHYQVRVVNPWSLPYQVPHPRMVVPGVTSTESIVFAADHQYPYLCLNMTVPVTKRIWEVYDRAAEEAGYVAGPEHRGYLMRCHVQRDGDKARAIAADFTWMMGDSIGIGNPAWNAPTGYSSFEARQARLRALKEYSVSIDQQFENLTLIAGTPKEVVAKIRVWLEETRPGTLIFMPNEGRVSHDDAAECIRLFGDEVLPAVREIADELDLPGPFEGDSGISPAARSVVQRPSSVA